MDTGAATVIAQIPSHWYVIAGGLVLANLGTVVTVFYGVGKLIWFISKLDSRVETLERNTEKDINAAHEAIRGIKKEFGTNATQ